MIFSENRFPLFRIMLNPTCHGGGKNEMNSAARSSTGKPDHTPDIHRGCAGGP
jgi:hypothetical protein